MTKLHTYLRQLARYSEWANGRLYEACSRLDQQRYRPHTDPSSIHALLNRLLVVDRLTLARLAGYDPGIDSLDEELHDRYPPLLDALLAEDVALVEQVRRLSEETLGQPVSYVDLDGSRHTNSQLELVTELLEQQAQLRGAIAERLASAGQTVPDLCFSRFVREAGGRRGSLHHP